MRIGILGMGGVGSFVGAKLAKNYEGDKTTKIIFICRGETKKHIDSAGLLFSSKGITINVKPDLASDDPEEIGLLDILIVATKSFSLIHAIHQYQTCLQPDTVIITLQNGVNAKFQICQHIHHDPSKILEGVIYVASNMEKPGIVNHLGGPGKIFFGNKDKSDYRWVEVVLKKGGLDITYTKEIKEILWKKFLFVSPLAAMTAALDIPFGEVAKNAANKAQLEKMMQEVQALARHFQVPLTDQDIGDSLAMLANFPYESKSSLQLDFEQNKEITEKQDLVDFVVGNGEAFGVNVDNYKEMEAKISGFSGGGRSCQP
ncbi:MAG: ketopantoate reductase family protein [Adhaeribacter sp.]